MKRFTDVVPNKTLLLLQHIENLVQVMLNQNSIYGGIIEQGHPYIYDQLLLLPVRQYDTPIHAKCAT